LSEQSFTGYQRAKKTRPGVLVSEVASKSIITVAGVGVIAAVFLVFVFLAAVALPLVRGTRVEQIHSYDDLALTGGAGGAALLFVDEFLIAGVESRDGGRTIRHFRLDTGEVLDEIELFDRAPTSISYTAADGQIAAGFEDGTTVVGNLRFETRFYEDADVPEPLRDLGEGDVGVFERSAIERTPIGQLRRQELVVEFDPPIAHDSREPIILIDQTTRSNGQVVATLNSDGALVIESITRRQNLLTGAVFLSTSGGTMQVPNWSADDLPVSLLVTQFADTVYLIWSDGRYARIDSRALDDIRIVEEGTLLPTGRTATRVTSARFLLGRGTILVGDDAGGVSTWFPARIDSAVTPDGIELVNPSVFNGSAPVTAIASSTRKRMIAVGYADGTARSFYITSEATLAEVDAFDGAAVAGIAVSPRDDAIALASTAGFRMFAHDAPHPEATMQALFAPIWYEGNSEPEHAWQSSSGTDTFEPKFGLMPLVFGTLKATFFSMLFGVPIALLAAIYTSEFLHGRLRAKIKPVIEMMASLPSVVLGFLAALVFAPFVARYVPTVLAFFFTVPLVLLLGGYLYQLLPRRSAVVLSKHRFTLVLFVALPAGILASMGMGPLLEKLLFAGNMTAWLDGQIGSGVGGWVLLLLPASAALVIWLMANLVNPRLRDRYRSMGDRTVSRVELLRFVIGIVVTVMIAWGVARIVTFAGFDSRSSFPVIGTVMSTYVQRNSLIVGFIMGFAIIPIIYTISDDALRSVPDHLRSASLASGATQWQTTTRIIIPTAMSGLFSAIMIGLGRAVGETMIVLMAAGNTPIMEMNIFNGFRTLAANIAVELPEAAAESTHYRILFLAALTLFLMTFVVNTVAESVRQRFRKRAYQL
jgi:phosphate transport system permease protein